MKKPQFVSEKDGEEILIDHLIGKLCILDGSGLFKLDFDRENTEFRLEMSSTGAFYVIWDVKELTQDGGYIVDVCTSQGAMIHRDVTLIEQRLSAK